MLMIAVALFHCVIGGITFGMWQRSGAAGSFAVSTLMVFTFMTIFIGEAIEKRKKD